MFHYELLPQLSLKKDQQRQLNLTNSEPGKRFFSKPSKQSGDWKPVDGSQSQTNAQDRGDSVLLFQLPPLISNSVPLKQHASAKESLVAASMISGTAVPAGVAARQTEPLVASSKNRPPTINSPAQRGVVSVVRPVLSTTNEATCYKAKDIQLGQHNEGGWQELQSSDREAHQAANLLDDFIELENQARLRVHEGQHLNSCPLAGRLGSLCLRPPNRPEARQQAAILRREQIHLTRGVKRQHGFVVAKLEQRKRSLLIIQAVWVQQDFRRAIHRLVDLYNEGLVFSKARCEADPLGQTSLSSLNTALVVDVLGVIVLRPKLWTLDTCQLLLPIVIHDLLAQQRRAGYEDHAELGLRVLKLVLIQFSSVIVATLSTKPVDSLGVDLSREERLNKCSSCYRLLQEARLHLTHWRPFQGIAANKLVGMCRELEQLFSLLDPLGLSPDSGSVSSNNRQAR